MGPASTLKVPCMMWLGRLFRSGRDLGSEIAKHTEPDAFFLCDLRDIANKVNLWRECLPRVVPYYAIKSCRDPVVLNILNNLGVSFDCTNKLEMTAVLNMGVSPDRIVLASTVKDPRDIEFALKHKVTFMTFDSVEELSKVEGKNVRFHVGSAYEFSEIFHNTIEKAKAVFDLAKSMGIHMTVLNVGGGFPGGLRKVEKFIKICFNLCSEFMQEVFSSPDDISQVMKFLWSWRTRMMITSVCMQVCENIRSATDLHFPASSGVKIIAEPGQFFITSCYVLVVQVIGKRHRDILVDGISQPHQDVFINESRNNCVSRPLYDFLDVRYWPLEEPLERAHNQLTTVWGGTCDPMDCLDNAKPLFDVRVGEWLLMDNIDAFHIVEGWLHGGEQQNY
ncbi:ornithine decarboxylase-like [Dermacentor andersoni]|uniref:ornithine decarboxylase-like n=1 Tax=Dermacentor andersoni TaxID=34620 RepID=UPI003B3B54C3